MNSRLCWVKACIHEMVQHGAYQLAPWILVTQFGFTVHVNYDLETPKGYYDKKGFFFTKC